MLNGDEVGADEGNMVHLTEHPDDTGMIDPLDHDREQVGKESGLFLEVERQSFVVTERPIVRNRSQKRLTSERTSRRWRRERQHP